MFYIILQYKHQSDMKKMKLQLTGIILVMFGLGIKPVNGSSVKTNTYDTKQEVLLTEVLDQLTKASQFRFQAWRISVIVQ